MWITDHLEQSKYEYRRLIHDLQKFIPDIAPEVNTIKVYVR